MALGAECRTALSAFLENAGESMNQSAAEAASVKSFFINGYLKGEDLAELASSAVEDPPLDTLNGNQLMSPSHEGEPSAGSQDGISDVTMLIASGENGQRGTPGDIIPPNSAVGSGPTNHDAPVDSRPGVPLATNMDHTAPLPAQPESPVRNAEVLTDAQEAQGSPSLSTAALSELDELTSSEDGLTDHAATVPPTNNDPSVMADEVRRASGRALKPPPIYTSGTILTIAAPPKKRLRVKVRDSNRSDTPAKVKQEDQYWETTQDYWYKAVSDPASFT